MSNNLKRKISYEQLVSNGGIDVFLLESGEWSVTMPDKLSKRDLILFRAMLNSLIEEQEIIK